MKRLVILVLISLIFAGCQQLSEGEIQALIDSKVEQRLAELSVEDKVNQHLTKLNLAEWQAKVDERFNEQMTSEISQQIHESLL